MAIDTTEKKLKAKGKKSKIGLIFWLAVFAITLFTCTIFGWKALAISGLSIFNMYLFIILAMELGKSNTFFTLIEEGQAKGVTIFGRAEKCLLSFTGHRFLGILGTMDEKKYGNHYHKDSWWDVYKLNQDNARPEDKSFWKYFWYNFAKHILFMDLGGLKWVGIWPFYKVYTYNFRWTSLRGQLPTGSVTERTKYEETRDRIIDYILVRQETYLLDLKGIEDQDLISVDIKLVWTNHVVNPFKALFRVRNWLETSTDRLLTYIRRGFAAATWKEFQTSGNLMSTFKDILDELEDKYGVATDGLEIIDLEPPEEFQQAAEKIRMAEAEVDIARHAAEAAIHEAAAITTKAEAEAGRIAKVMGAAKDLGDDGVAMKISEDLAKGGKAVVVMGTARELVNDILGGKERKVLWKP